MAQMDRQCFTFRNRLALVPALWILVTAAIFVYYAKLYNNTGEPTEFAEGENNLNAVREPPESGRKHKPSRNGNGGEHADHEVDPWAQTGQDAIEGANERQGNADLYAEEDHAPDENQNQGRNHDQDQDLYQEMAEEQQDYEEPDNDRNPNDNDDSNISKEEETVKAVDNAKEIKVTVEGDWPHVPMEHEFGEEGLPVEVDRSSLSPDDLADLEDGEKTHDFNRYVSDMISVRRSVPDYRDTECLSIDYPAKLPQTSVIIVFRNEAWTVLLRTVHSVLDRSPPHLLKEIILVDDDSDPVKFGHLHAPLDAYLAQFPNVSVKRAGHRLGLIRGRLLGAEVAKGEVMTFLDSHCEVEPGWLEPLLARVAEDKRHVVMPVIEIINNTNFMFTFIGDGEKPQVGSFYWDMTFTFITLPSQYQLLRKKPSDPARSPTMAGGLFSINRDYFYEIGSYDSQMDIWGAENLEMSFRIWMCGGTLELIPCSRVGHMFRSHNWNHDDRKFGHSAATRNTQRMVEVWLDEYKEIFYRESHQEPEQELYGDVSERVQLRASLRCKSFSWYLTNVHPDKFIPTAADNLLAGFVENAVRVNNTPLCMATQRVSKRVAFSPTMEPCETVEEMLYLSKKREIRNENHCLVYRDSTGELEFMRCDWEKKNQHWKEKAGTLRHMTSSKCLSMDPEGTRVQMKTCRASQLQIWDWQRH